MVDFDIDIVLAFFYAVENMSWICNSFELFFSWVGIQVILSCALLLDSFLIIDEMWWEV